MIVLDSNWPVGKGSLRQQNEPVI